jgi:hypothetical protein
MKAKILVCGGREFGYFPYYYSEPEYPELYSQKEKERKYFERIMAKADKKYDIRAIIQGGAEGADKLARRWALERPWVEDINCPADWNKYGKKAGILRNQTMLELNPTLVIAFPGGIGTKDMVTRSIKAGFKVIEVPSLC